VAARARQGARTGDARLVNAALSGRAGRSVLKPTPEGKALLDRAVDRLTLSARAYQRVLRVARTIADLAGNASVGAPEVAEALRFRPGRDVPEAM
jgi:magnesium chelatase family protein